MSLRVAIIGFGASGQRMADIASRTNPGSEVLILSQHLPGGGLYSVTGSYQDVIAFHPDVVVLTSPASLREDDVEALGGIPGGFLIEKLGCCGVFGQWYRLIFYAARTCCL